MITPGEWLYESGEVVAADGVSVIARADRERGCRIPPVERDSNMRLCAAAPRLLEVLAAALPHLPSEYRAEALAAIAKASGA